MASDRRRSLRPLASAVMLVGDVMAPVDQHGGSSVDEGVMKPRAREGGMAVSRILMPTNRAIDKVI